MIIHEVHELLAILEREQTQPFSEEEGQPGHSATQRAPHGRGRAGQGEAAVGTNTIGGRLSGNRTPDGR